VGFLAWFEILGGALLLALGALLLTGHVGWSHSLVRRIVVEVLGA